MDHEDHEASKALPEDMICLLVFGNIDEAGWLEGDLLDEDSKRLMGYRRAHGVAESIYEEIKADLVGSDSASGVIEPLDCAEDYADITEEWVDEEAEKCKAGKSEKRALQSVGNKLWFDSCSFPRVFRTIGERMQSGAK